jgi:hypothetical protein
VARSGGVHAERGQDLRALGDPQAGDDGGDRQRRRNPSELEALHAHERERRRPGDSRYNQRGEARATHQVVEQDPRVGLSRRTDRCQYDFNAYVSIGGL